MYALSVLHNYRAVDIGEYTFIHLVFVHGCHDRAVPDRDDKRQVIQQNQRVFRALGLGLLDRLIELLRLLRTDLEPAPVNSLHQMFGKFHLPDGAVRCPLLKRRL